jgi:hypothetical protein
MTYEQLFDSAGFNEEMPYKDEIQKGETTSFMFQGKMTPVEVVSIGWDFVKLVSLDLEFTFDRILKSDFIKQRNLINDYLLNPEKYQ